MDERAKIYAGLSNNNAIIKISGHATWQVSTLLKNHQDHNLETILAADHLVFDLCQCTFLDSTMIGLISHLGVKYFKQNNRQASLLYGNDKIKNILELMNCNRILLMVSGVAEETAESNPIQELLVDHAMDRAELRNTMLLAHKALVELTDDLGGQFTEVIDDLEHPSK